AAGTEHLRAGCVAEVDRVLTVRAAQRVPLAQLRLRQRGAARLGRGESLHLPRAGLGVWLQHSLHNRLKACPQDRFLQKSRRDLALAGQERRRLGTQLRVIRTGPGEEGLLFLGRQFPGLLNQLLESQELLRSHGITRSFACEASPWQSPSPA